MKTASDHKRILTQTYELGQARLRLRSDLQFTLHQDKTTQWYLVEDESRANYFRVGITEYAFLSLLDGKRTLDEAIARLASLGCCDDLSEQKAAGLARWVIDSGLAETAASISQDRIHSQRNKEAMQRSMQWLNPVAFRIPLFNPDPLLKTMHRLLRPFFGWTTMLVWLLICIAGTITCAMVLGDFWQQQIQSFSSLDLVWIAVAWLGIKVVHESAHGLVCKHFGGRVPQVGVLILLLIPLPYVDVSSSWRFAYKSQRIFTAAAGILAELFIASIAIMVWAGCQPGPLKYHVGNLFLAATLHTLLFNANPLMRFDGYYMLSDWLEIPNLYTRGRIFVRSFCKWWFFGVRSMSQVEPSRAKTRMVRLYGVTSLAWMVLICVSLGLGAIGMFSGIGLLVAVAAGCFWLGIPLFQLLRYLIRRHETERPNRFQFVAVSTVLAGSLIAVFTCVPSPGSTRAPFVVQYDDLAVIRAQSAGFVHRIHVTAEQDVKQGDVLVTLINPDLEGSIDQMKSSIAASRLRAEVHKNNGDVATWQIEHETLESLLHQQAELLEQQRQLTVTSPQSGKILDEDLHQLAGVYVRPGDEVVSIGDPDSKHALAMVNQSDAVWLRTREDRNDAKLHVWGTGESALPSSIRQISPRATDQLPHFSFASMNGGPLSVVSRAQVESDPTQQENQTGNSSRLTWSNRSELLQLTASQHDGSSQSTANLKLVNQYVPIEVELHPDDAKRLLVGQTGCLLVQGRESSLGQFVYHNVSRWLSNQIKLTHGL